MFGRHYTDFGLNEVKALYISYLDSCAVRNLK